MATDIITFIEVRKFTPEGEGLWMLHRENDRNKKGEEWFPWGQRRYGLFAILAGICNYSNIDPISKPRGWPDDCSIDQSFDPDIVDSGGKVCYTHYRLDELLVFTWDKHCVIVPGERINSKRDFDFTYRDVAGDQFFRHLAALERIADSASNLRVLIAFVDDGKEQ